MGSRIWLPPSIMDPNNAVCATLMDTCFWPFAHLETLSLSLNDRDWTAPFFFRPITGLQILLSINLGLKKLDLCLPINNGTDEGNRYSMEQICPLQPTMWPRLEVFKVSCLRVDVVQLLRRMMFEMPALRVLQLLCIELMSHTWEVVIECMSRTMQLSSFLIDRCLGLLYPDRKAIWSAESHVIDINHRPYIQDDHERFLEKIEQYVVR